MVDDAVGVTVGLAVDASADVEVVEVCEVLVLELALAALFR